MSQNYTIGFGSRNRRAKEGGRENDKRCRYDDSDRHDGNQGTSQDGGSYDGRDRDRSGRVNSGCVDKPSFRSRNKGDRTDDRGRGGRKGKSGRFKRVIPHYLHEGVFIFREREGTIVLLTKNLVPGVTVHNEKKIYAVDNITKEQIEYRVWDPLRFKLAAAILEGIGNYIKPGSNVLYLGAVSSTNVSHISDIVGPEGTVCAVVRALRAGKELVEVAHKRSNIIPIIADAMHPEQYRMLMGLVDVIFVGVVQQEQAEIVVKNARNYLKNGGHFILFLKANFIDRIISSSEVKKMFKKEINELQTNGLRLRETITLKPDHCVVVGVYKPI